MSKSLVGRCGGKRVIFWGRVWARGLDAALVAFVLFLIVTCVVGASSEAPFFETRWGQHVFVLLLGSLALAVLVGAALPLRRWVRVPLDQLPELDAASDGAGPEEQSARRIRRRGVAALAAVVAVPLLVVLFYLEENERGEHAWNRYQQQQEARGERLDPAAVAPPAVPDDQNFAATPYLAPLFDFLPGTQQARDPSAGGSHQEPLSPRYQAAPPILKSSKLARSNSWPRRNRPAGLAGGVSPRDELRGLWKKKLSGPLG